MDTGYLLGIDVGTTNTKAVVFDPAAGKVVAVADRPTVTRHPKPEWGEYDPAQLWEGIVATVREATAGRADSIKAVAVASMAEAGVPIDRDGRYLYPIIVWNDPRSEPQTRRWHDWLGPKRVFEITGQAIQVKYTVNKLLWLRDNEPEVIRHTHKWLCIEDFALWKFSGTYATDYSVASRTMAFDQRARRWSSEMLGRAGFAADLMPEPHPSGTVVGQVTPQAAAETGLSPDTLVVTGGHDHLCGAFAAGNVGPGSLLDSMGTAEACLLVTDSFSTDQRLIDRGYCQYAYVMPDHYVVHFGIVASGEVLDWLVTQLWPEAAESAEGRRRAFAAALAAAEAVPPGSEGVFWLPHLRGIATPWRDELSKAAMVGLTPAHGRGHFVRALLEGMSYWMRENLESLGEIIPVAREAELTAIGGSTRAALWMQTRADVTGRPVKIVEVPQAVAVGAALLAGVGAGVFPSYEAATESVVRSATVYEPDPARHRAYSNYYEAVYRELYPTLKSVNQRIHEIFWSEGRLAGKG
ncbi:MAG: FGGY family carbohydrate kinase [Dehalococcoidales bacterium]|nr:FGGY family carbohydrate kinase [Dehalococcoidales bacterium]